MELFRIKRDIPFMRHALAFNIFSFITFALAVFFLWSKGLNLSIEFTGGAVVEARYEQPANVEGIRKAMEAQGVGEPLVTLFGSSRDVLIRLSARDMQKDAFSRVKDNGVRTIDADRIIENVLRAGGPLVKEPFTQADGTVVQKEKVQRVELISGQVGRELYEAGALALLVVCIGIMIYLAFRFEWKFAVAAIIANLHDIVIILGVFAFFQWEFSLAVLAAVLAVLGYSVNESVIIADRIRENFRKMRKASVTEVIDNAITSTISRTIITHGTTETMVIFMLLFGGPVLHYFAVALTIGIVFGIYSSVLVMAPITKWLGISREDLIKPIKKEGEDQPELEFPEPRP
ncbi:protein translocase subunit SecF [Piscinibacterium candidicorallinum]|uniref:Protein-export membrane protein SecF n=1 Tax=Piscinibacterium candidicorallinum TaxID=1793872 RepID=A0ABV7H1Z4_9BURK